MLISDGNRERISIVGYERKKSMEKYNMMPQKRPRRNGNGFLMGFLGVIIGALLVWFLMPGANETGVKDATDNNKPEENNNAQEDGTSVIIHTEITDMVEKVADSVVGVTNLQMVQDVWSSTETTKETGSGSGVIYKNSNGKAKIVTNHHVVAGATELEITFDDGTKAEGRLVGSDIWTDLAVIEIDSAAVGTVAEFGDSDVLKRGETVIAIGNPLGLGFSGSVTVGVVSGKDRSIPIDFDKDGSVDWYSDVLQTDAAINPGNSGGALMNLAGQLIGINSMKISEDTIEGIGLAIPINLAAPIIEQLEEDGEVIRPTMGVTLLDLSTVPSIQQREILKLPQAVSEGVVINQVLKDSPANNAGMQKYDVIVEMDKEKIGDMVSLRKHLYNEKKVGDTMVVKVYREGKSLEIEMILERSDSF